MRYATIKPRDIANGPGIRVSLFVSGCRHACKGCFNEDIWSFKKGEEYTKEIEDYIVELVGKDYIKGISLLGGEPLEPENQESVYYLIKRLKEEYPQKDVWCYSGFTYEYITRLMMKHLPYTKDMFKYIDVLVDGKFVLELLDLKLRFRGSANQRVIDIRKTFDSYDKGENEIIWALDDSEKAKYRLLDRKKKKEEIINSRKEEN